MEVGRVRGDESLRFALLCQSRVKLKRTAVAGTLWKNRRSSRLACTWGFDGKGECRQGSRELHNDVEVSFFEAEKKGKDAHQALSLLRQGRVEVKGMQEGEGNGRTLCQRLRTMKGWGKDSTPEASSPNNNLI